MAVHIILLILGEIWSKGSNLTSLLLVAFAEVSEVNTKALNIKSCQPQQKHCRGKAEAKCIFMQLPQHLQLPHQNAEIRGLLFHITIKHLCDRKSLQQEDCKQQQSSVKRKSQPASSHQVFLSQTFFVPWQRKVYKMHLFCVRTLLYLSSLNFCYSEFNYITAVY